MYRDRRVTDSQQNCCQRGIKTAPKRALVAENGLAAGVSRWFVIPWMYRDRREKCTPIDEFPHLAEYPLCTAIDDWFPIP